MDFQLCFGKRGRAEIHIHSAFGYLETGFEKFPAETTLPEQGEASPYFIQWNPREITRMGIQRRSNLNFKTRHLANLIGYGQAATEEGTAAFRYYWIDFPHWLFPLPFAFPIGRWLIRWCRGERWKIKGECVLCGCYLRENQGMCRECEVTFMDEMARKVVAQLEEHRGTEAAL